MKIELEVTSCMIVEGSGTDDVLLTTDKPSACWPFDKENLTVKFATARGTGQDYLRRNFPTLTPQIVSVTPR